VSELNNSILTNLHNQIARHFGLEELQALALELNLEWDELPGHTKTIRLHALLIYLAKTRRLNRLIVLLQQKRPGRRWPMPPPPDRQPQLAPRTFSLPTQATTSARPSRPPRFSPHHRRQLWQQVRGRPWIFWPSLTVAIVTIAVFFFLALISAGTDLGPAQEQLYQWGLLSRFPAERNGETLIIIATSGRPEGVVDNDIYGAIQSAIEAQRDRAGMKNIRVEVEPAAIAAGDRQTAAALGHKYDASIIIWGAVTGAGAEPNFLTLKQPDDAAAAHSGDGQAEPIRPELVQPDAYTPFIIQALPDHIAFLALFALGQAAYSQADLVQAISLIQSAVNLTSEAPLPANFGIDAAHFHLGYLHQVTEQLDRAIVDYGQVIQRSPQDAIAFNNRGNAYADLGQYEAALADYTQAIQLNPLVAPAFYNRGNLNRNLGHYEAAMADYTQAIQLNPQVAATFNNRGIIYADLGQYEAALADYTQAIQLNPQYALAFNNRGNAYRNLDDYEAALADYTQAIRLNPQYANAFNNRGATYADLGQYEVAQADFDQAIRLDPQFKGAFYFRGNTYAGLGQYEAAIADYDQAIRFDPEFAAAFHFRGIAHSEIGDHQAALADFDQAIQLGLQDADLFLKRGTIYYNLGKVESAIANFQRYLELAPDAPNRTQLENLIQQHQAELSP
jgi:tetratricopeptide (TPR) repeat protein